MTDLLALRSSAVFSACRTWRYRLDREVQDSGIVILYSGINGSTAAEDAEDQTTLKWRGFTLRNGGRKYIAVNPFAFCATDVGVLAKAADPIGPDNDRHIREALGEADLIVPCWGNRSKVPDRLRFRLDALLALFQASGKPMKAFGFTRSNDPKHPLMLGYDTVLIDWPTEEASP